MSHMDTSDSISRGGVKFKGPGASGYLKGARKPVLSRSIGTECLGPTSNFVC